MRDPNPCHMAPKDTVLLTGTYESRVAQLLKAARHQARLAQGGARPRMHDALTELDYILEDQIAALADAVKDDEVDAARDWAA